MMRTTRSRGTKAQPYSSNTMGAVTFEYPDGKWDPDRNVQEFAADRLGMVVILGFFYQGSDERIEINNETSVRGYSHPMLQPNGIYELVRLAKLEAGKDFPVSMSWSGGIMPRGSKGTWRCGWWTT